MSAAATQAGDVPPNQTIYVRNLNEKVKKDELKRALYAVFNQFGAILDIVAMKTIKCRGQAWIVFNDVGAATNALRQMQDFVFFDKPMDIAFAKTKSDTAAKLDGSYVAPSLRDRKRRRAADAERAAKQVHQIAAASSAPATLAPAPNMTEPNKILYVQNIPEGFDDIKLLFSRYPGFKDLRMIPGKHDIAFVEFVDEAKSTVALQGLHNFEAVKGQRLVVSFRKK